MTDAELRTALMKIAAEMCRYPPEGKAGVYIRRSIVNGQLCEYAVRIKRALDAFRDSRP